MGRFADLYAKHDPPRTVAASVRHAADPDPARSQPRTPSHGTILPRRPAQEVSETYVFVAPHLPHGTEQCRFRLADLRLAHARIEHLGIAYVWCHGCAQLQCLVPCDRIGGLLEQVRSDPGPRTETITLQS